MDPRDLAFTGAADLARMLAAGTVTAPALLEVYLDRITRIDGPLRSYRVVLADAARREAALAQDRLDAGERLPLLGVPVAIKDDTDVAGEVTTFGTRAHGPAATADSAVVRLLREAGALLRDLGHHVVERDVDHPPSAALGNAIPRYFRGVHDDVRALPHPERLERRTRAFARIGGLVSDRRVAALRAAEVDLTARITAIFDDVDVVLTPGTATGPSRIGAYQRRGALATLAMVAARVPFQAMCNLTGQPAAVVPWALDGTGIPTAVQLIGRPFDEATLLALAHQMEAARPWAGRRPPVD